MTYISNDRARNYLIVIWVIGCSFILKSHYSDVVDQERHTLEQKSHQAAQKIEASVLFYQDLAKSLSSKRLIRQVLTQEQDQLPQLNRFLHEISRRWQDSELYIANPEGHIIASSNFASNKSFIGQEINFREYFKQAIQGQSSRFYGQGIVIGNRGYFYAEPIYLDNKVIGIIVVKQDLEPLLDSIDSSQQDYIIAGIDGVIFASSKAKWVYHSLYQISDERAKVINASLRYGQFPSLNAISALSGEAFFNAIAKGILKVDGSSTFVVGSAHILGLNWHVLNLSPISHVMMTLLAYIVVYSLVLAVLYLSYIYQLKRFELRQYIQRQNQNLEQQVSALTAELTHSNIELRELVEHYQHSQAELQQTQDQLVQSAKLAVLGEMSAGINHELNQPLMALQTYAQNGQKLLQRQQFEKLGKNLDEINKITTIMHNIVARFKVFARKTPPKPRPSFLQDAISSALVIIKPLLKQQNIELQYQASFSQAKVLCEPVQIEQVLINLLSNACDACEQITQPCIKVWQEQTPTQLKVFVQDNGKGISSSEQDDIFQPFFTTKADGLGIGLAISKRILETHNGQLSYFRNNDAGMTFVMSLNIIT